MAYPTIEWQTQRNRCEADHVPIFLDGSKVERELRVLSLPVMSIGKVEHAQYELIHVFRMSTHEYLSNLKPGYHYSVVDGQEYTEFVSVIQWEAINRPHECGPSCKACRMSCGCGCAAPAAVDLFKSTVIHVGPDDVVKYHRRMADGTRQITVTRGVNKVGDS